LSILFTSVMHGQANIR